MNWHDYFTYDCETGNLIWKERPRCMFKSDSSHRRMNTVLAGKVAGYVNHMKMPSGSTYDCVYVNVEGRMRKASRIIWEMHYGPIPDGMLIDHINAVSSDNRLSNLRLATKSQNGMNRGPQKRSSSGLKGINMDKRDGVWSAEITVNGKKISLGRHQTKGLAALAYAKAALRYHGEFARITATR